jgi:hypothetical protein
VASAPDGTVCTFFDVPVSDVYIWKPHEDNENDPYPWVFWDLGCFDTANGFAPATGTETEVATATTTTGGAEGWEVYTTTYTETDFFIRTRTYTSFPEASTTTIPTATGAPKCANLGYIRDYDPVEDDGPFGLGKSFSSDNNTQQCISQCRNILSPDGKHCLSWAGTISQTGSAKCYFFSASVDDVIASGNGTNGELLAFYDAECQGPFPAFGEPTATGNLGNGSQTVVPMPFSGNARMEGVTWEVIVFAGLFVMMMVL